VDDLDKKIIKFLGYKGCNVQVFCTFISTRGLQGFLTFPNNRNERFQIDIDSERRWTLI